MSEIKAKSGRKSITIQDKDRQGMRLFSFSFNGYSSTGIFLDDKQVELLREALAKLED